MECYYKQERALLVRDARLRAVPPGAALGYERMGENVKGDETVREALNFALDTTGLPLSVIMQINGGVPLYTIRIAINTERVAAKALGYHDLTGQLSANQAALYLWAYAVGYQYGNGKLRVGLKPPVYHKRRKKG